MQRLVLLLGICFIGVNGLTMTLKSGKEECIWEEGTTGDQLYASYEVTKGEAKGLIVTVRFAAYHEFVDQGRKQQASVFWERQERG